MPWGPTRGSERRLARRPVPATSPPLSPLTGATRGRFRPVPHIPGRSAPHADGPCVSPGSECSPGAVSAKGGAGDPAWPHTPRPAEKPCPLARPGGSPRPSGHGGFESARRAAAVPGRVSGHCPGLLTGGLRGRPPGRTRPPAAQPPSSEGEHLALAWSASHEGPRSAFLLPYVCLDFTVYLFLVTSSSYRFTVHIFS